ncbi:DUF4365 domain-containing protein [Streptomyces sp. M2CJ-2]|uniref:DUF4365 domain-containing protein n=1 Tax=Streptomyces sp. M2CJ-2 TaxID=2803948 RepID=UPI001925DA04|nr:DUF4365 domain-containing protein [Streptomyces sp. M2CJ-2]MBL3669790.1 DUF4365 domain-containing protein [Streptomyces sp. M2CJ-2]
MSDPIGPKIQPQHLTGNAGESLVRLTFLEAGVPMISVDQGDDYGTDLIAQVPHSGTNQLSGALVRIQVKCGRSKYHKSDGTGRCQLDVEHRAYYADGPIPSVLITVDPDSKRMHWGNITEQLQRNRDLTALSAPHPFSTETVPQILRVARQAGPGDWVLALSNSDPVARRIAIEGCLLMAHQDSRVLDLLRAYTTRMEIEDISFLAARISEEERKHFGQQTLIDFRHHWGNELEELLPAQRSHWQRPPYPRDLMDQLVNLFEFSKNDMLEIIERNEERVDINLLESSTLKSAASILDLRPAEHAERLMEIVFDGDRGWTAADGRVRYSDAATPIFFMKALELDASKVELTCERRGIRVMDVIIAIYHEKPQLAAAMWALWSE